MPLTRYRIRDEYSLADPELYRAADRDDPEALLEGVAMAGLVGVLRQLGDLAEFAAEVFNDLHEEVMATAARGHGVMIRVQQLESEFPSIEKAFLSQTSHSLFLYNAGIDWHPYLRMNQNLITHGDLPRFLMDSYEECRGPPQLFLLDKFDIAGAGACQKRYSDPSFFKVGVASSEATEAEVQREKKARKIKKKGSRWRNGETPEVFPTSNVTLHQLFSVECNHTSNNVPAHLVKLKKRQFKGSPFDSTTGKSYMEKFLETRSPECKVISESCASHPRLEMRSSNTSESILEIHEITTRSLAENSLPRESSPIASPDRQEMLLEAFINEGGEDVIDDEILEKLPEPKLDGGELEKASLNFHKVENQRKSAADGESKTEASAEGYPSDDITSEMDNFMDALTTMESEMETDTEDRPKNNQGFFNYERQGTSSATKEEHKELEARSLDSPSIGNSSASDDENNSFKKVRSSVSYSHTLSNLAENEPSDGDVVAKVFSSNEICPVKIVDLSSGELSRNRDNIGANSPQQEFTSGTCNELCEMPFDGSESREASCSSFVIDAPSTHLHLSSGASSSEGQVVGSESIEMSSGPGRLSNAEECDQDLVVDVLCTTNVSGPSLQIQDDYSPAGSAERQPITNSDGGTRDVSSEYLMHLSNFPDMDLDMKNYENALIVPPEESAEDSSIENLESRKLDSLHSVTLDTKEQIHGMSGSDLEVSSGVKSSPKCLPSFSTPCDLDAVKPVSLVAEIGNVIPATEVNSEYLTMTIDTPQCGDFSEQEFHEPTDEVSILESVSEDVGTSWFEEKLLYKSQKEMTDTSIYEKKYGFTLDEVHMSLDLVGSDDLSLGSPSSSLKPSSDIDNRLLFDDSDIGIVQERSSEDNNTMNPELFRSLSQNIKFQEDHISSDVGSDPDELGTKSSCLDYHIESNVEGEANQLTGAPIGLDGKLCNPEPYDFSSSELIDNVHDLSPRELTEKDLHISGTAEPTSSKNNQKGESKFPNHNHLSEGAEGSKSSPTDFLSELGAPLEQSMESQGLQLNVESLHEDGQNVKSSVLQSDQTQASNEIDQDGCIEFDAPLSQHSETEFSTLPDTHSAESFEPAMDPFDSILPHFGTLSEAICQQPLEPPPNRPVLDFTLPVSDTLQTNMDELPPLPPLPPIQWRIGKLQHSSLASEVEMMQHSVNPFSIPQPATVDEKATQGFPTSGVVAQPLNPFLLVSAMEDEKPQHGSGTLKGDTLQYSQNPFLSQEPFLDDEISQLGFLSLEGKVAEPTNPFLTLPTTDDQKASLNAFTPLSSIEDMSPGHASLQGKLEQASLATKPVIDYEKLRPTSVNLDGEMVNLPNSFSSQPAKDDDQPAQGSQILEREIAWTSNTCMLLPAVEDGKPNGSYQMRHPRQRDPLIEAVASHDKSSLRKVTERVPCFTGPKAEERDSLLEQIRSKSFNLKPAVAPKPSIQGPKTNLKVVAILEKANAIRQAFAGSDEDDDADSWCDS